MKRSEDEGLSQSHLEPLKATRKVLPFPAYYRLPREPEWRLPDPSAVVLYMREDPEKKPIS